MQPNTVLALIMLSGRQTFGNTFTEDRQTLRLANGVLTWATVGPRLPPGLKAAVIRLIPSSSLSVTAQWMKWPKHTWLVRGRARIQTQAAWLPDSHTYLLPVQTSPASPPLSPCPAAVVSGLQVAGDHHALWRGDRDQAPTGCHSGSLIF